MLARDPRVLVERMIRHGTQHFVAVHIFRARAKSMDSKMDKQIKTLLRGMDAVASQYGWSVDGEGRLSNSRGKHAADIVFQRGRARVQMLSGDLVYSFAAGDSEGIGRFLERYYCCERKRNET